MTSINWTPLDQHSLRPVPLPREKLLLDFGSVSLSLSPIARPTPASPPSPEYKVEKGTLYVSNQRVIFVSPPSLPGTASSASTCAATPPALESLSIPYNSFQDGRLHQPFFGANYFEAKCSNKPDGGLPCPHTIKLYFKEGGGFDFYSTVLEMKERLAAQPQPQPRARRSRTSSTNNVNEDLPLYTATPPASTPPTPPRSRVSSHSQSDHSEAPTVSRRPERTASDLPPPPAPLQLSTTVPSGEDQTGARPPPPPIGNDAPPSYSA